MKIFNYEFPYELVKRLVLTDFKLRYQGSVLGYVWSLLKPMMLFGVLYFVFTKFVPVGKGVPHYPAYLLLGIVVWSFFIESSTLGMNSILARGDLVRKVRISKIIIVFSSMLSALVNLILNLIVVMIFMVITRVPFHATMLLLPLLIAELLCFVFGISLLLSTMFVKYRDISHIWEVILQMLFYGTPIIYSLAQVTEHSLRAAKILSLSPLAQIIQDARWLVISHETTTTHALLGNWLSWLLSIVSITFLLVLGILIFRKQSRSFAENL